MYIKCETEGSASHLRFDYSKIKSGFSGFFNSCGLGSLFVLALGDKVAQTQQRVGEVDVLDDGGAVRLGKLNIGEVPDSLYAVLSERVGYGDRRPWER